MKLTVRGHGVAVTDEMREHAERKVEYAFDRFGPRITAVDIVLQDENGPRGGVDKRCHVAVHGRRGWVVRAGDEADEFLAAIDRAVDRAARAVVRTLERRGEFRERASAADVGHLEAARRRRAGGHEL
jgi:ribosomal subunit interface protein